VGPVILKEFSGNELKTPRGSLRSLTDLLPVFVTVVVTFMFSDPSPFELRSETMTVKLMSISMAGAAETATAEATRATREARREEKSIVIM